MVKLGAPDSMPFEINAEGTIKLFGLTCMSWFSCMQILTYWEVSSGLNIVCCVRIGFFFSSLLLSLIDNPFCSESTLFLKRIFAFLCYRICLSVWHTHCTENSVLLWIFDKILQSTISLDVLSACNFTYLFLFFFSLLICMK